MPVPDLIFGSGLRDPGPGAPVGNTTPVGNTAVVVSVCASAATTSGREASQRR